MWKRFTERAKQVVFVAHEHAQRHGGGIISTEHLLLGLLSQSDSSAIDILEGLNVNLRSLLAEVERAMPRGENHPTQDMTLGSQARKAVDLAEEEARNLKADHIGTAHL